MADRDTRPGAGPRDRGRAVPGGRSDSRPGRQRLWRSDGTEAGTARVADLVPGPGGSAPANLAAGCGRLWFTATTPATGRELWVLDLPASSCGVPSQHSCTQHADCNDGDPATADWCDTESGCFSFPLACSGDAQCDDGDACTIDRRQPLAGCSNTLRDGVDGLTCLLGASGSEAARCRGEALSPQLAKRFDRIRRAVTRLAAATNVRAGEKRVRGVLRATDRTIARLDREVTRAAVSTACRAALIDLIGTVRVRVQALPLPPT